MVGYASDETEDPHEINTFDDKNGDLWWLSPEQRQCTSTRRMLTSVSLTKASCAGTRVVRWGMKCRSHSRRCACRQGYFYVGAGDQGTTFGTRVMRLRSPSSSTFDASSFGKKLNDGCKHGDLWWLRPGHAGGVHVGKDDVDVDAGGQDITFGCASEGID